VNADWPASLDITAGYHGGDEFSEQAHESIQEDKVSLRRRVFAHIERCPHGATCEEVELALGLSHQTVSARITELRARRQIVTIARERRRTQAGRWARVHRARVQVRTASA
jgi:hypothetical protein